jgi:5-formyltetrahydrofolate cyclo-ligase
VGDELQAVLADPGTTLRLGAFGIPEATGEPIDPAEIDVVVVPGLAFTPDGRRLGQGGGHFDRFLAALDVGDGRSTPPLLVGVCFHEQVLDDVPTEPHDRHVDLVVTDRETFRRRSVP